MIPDKQIAWVANSMTLEAVVFEVVDNLRFVFVTSRILPLVLGWHLRIVTDC